MSTNQDPKFYAIHFMPYADLPEDVDQYPSTWVDFPNKHFNPENGRLFYERYISELILADKLGFDGICFNEHHQSAYSMMPSAALIAAHLAPQTKHAKLCAFGPLVNLQYPNRTAEELAMLDLLSGGRLEVGFPVGIPTEYFSSPSMINPTTARQRYFESLDIIRKIWSEDGPFEYEGEIYNYRFLNVWPKPYQTPHPKVWLLGGASPETAQYAAEHGLKYASAVMPFSVQAKAFQAFRDQANEIGRKATSDDIMMGTFTYVAETDEIAVKEAIEHLSYYFKTFLKWAPQYGQPPGYVSPESVKRMLSSGGVIDFSAMTQDDILTKMPVIVGSPDTVASRYEQLMEELGATNIVSDMHYGNMPHWKTVKNLTMFAHEVMPRLKKKKTAHMHF